MRRWFGFEDQRGCALAEDCATAVSVERTEDILSEQAKPVVMEKGFRLDRGVVPNGHHAIGFSGTNGGGGFGEGNDSADALVGDTAIGAFESMANPDVAKDVIG